MSYVAPTHSWPSSEAVPSAPVVSSFASVVPSANVLAPVGVTVNRTSGRAADPSSLVLRSTSCVGRFSTSCSTASASTVSRATTNASLVTGSLPICPAKPPDGTVSTKR